MKKMKKIFALLLALAMVLGMTTTAFAADGTAAVTITGAENTVYKYMQLVVEDRDSTLGWQFATEEIATAFVEAFKVESKEDAIITLIGLGIIEATNGENYSVELGAINPSAALAKALDTLKNKATGNIEGNSVDFTSFGLYMITAQHNDYSYIPMAVYINTEYEDVAAVAKGAKNEITKAIDSEDDKSVSQGDVVEYTAITQYPYYGADVANPIFTITDKLTNATYNKDSVEVYFDVNGDGKADEENDKLLDAENNYTVKITSGTTEDDYTEKMVIEFDYNPSYASEKVIIKYSVTVGAGAEAVGNKISTNFDTTEDYVELDKVEVNVVKVNDKNEKLAGATFKIYEAVATATTGYTEYKDVTVNGVEGKGTLYLKDVTKQSLPEGVAEATTDENGILTFVGLDAQKTYYVQETNAPVGYKLNDNFYLLDNGTETGDTDDEKYEFANFADEEVVNTKLSALPSTGGIGTTIFTIGGCAIMIAAAFFFFVSRRKDA